MTATVRVRTGQMTKFMISAGLSQVALANQMGMSHTTVGRVLRGSTAPGEKFIAGALAAFPHLDFADLFEVVTDEAA